MSQKIDGRKTRDKSTYYFKDLSQKKFGNLVAVQSYGVNKWGNHLWLCRCSCGKTKIVASGKLTSGRSTNCGCKTSEIKAQNASTHGITIGGKPRTLVIWNGMKARCLNPKATSNKAYGARGISICDEWLGVDGFKNFHVWAMENGYADNLSIDRIDNDGNYEPCNCRWVPLEENIRQQRKTRLFTINNTEMSISAWCKTVGISKTVAYKALNKSEEAFIRLIQEKIG